MRPITIAIPASNPTAPIPLDVYQIGPVEWAIIDVSGVVSIDLEFTLDDVFAVGYNPAAGNWFATAAASTNVAAAGGGRVLDAAGNLITPTAVRFNNGGVGTATGRILQSGVMG